MRTRYERPAAYMGRKQYIREAYGENGIFFFPSGRLERVVIGRGKEGYMHQESNPEFGKVGCSCYTVISNYIMQISLKFLTTK